jgi:signal transduction histidine kinase
MSNFTAMARIVSHLGDQLISSSTVALLELIKNAYDAGSNTVTIKIDQARKTMTIEDKGHGMTLNDIATKYLVIGTTSRLKDKNKLRKNPINKNDQIKAPLGEKGLGRFATMKLGEKLVLLTKSKSETCILGVNWKQFDYESEKTLEQVNVHLFGNQNNPTENSDDTFTKIKIIGLKDFCDDEYWPRKQFEKYYKENFSKFINPFKPNKGFQIKLEVTTSNGDFFRLTPSVMDKKILEQAPYQIKGIIQNSTLFYEYYIRGEDLKEHWSKKQETYIIEELNFINNVENFGEIEFEFYFFNRTEKRLKEIKGIEEISQIKKFINQYNGGVMIYRDNFRVLPYAEPGNDWLELDKGSFRSKGIRFNTIQTIGAIHISSLGNPNLKDQTNREGLVHNKAYLNLSIALRQTIQTFNNKIKELYPEGNKKEKQKAENKLFESIIPMKRDFEEFKKNLNTYFENNTLNNVLINNINTNFNLIDQSFINIKRDKELYEIRIKEIEEQQKMILELAGIGLTAETVAHEMRSYLDRIVGFLKIIGSSNPNLKKDINLLIQNTRSLESVVSRLDIQTVTKRRTKSKINLVDLIEEICNSKLKVWEMEGKASIEIHIEYEDDCYIKANEGMLIQVFDNLLNNSRYWLLKRAKKTPTLKPTINIDISNAGEISFYDNGLGIQEIDSEHIFEPFFSRSKEGKGLGLYITQSILSFHDADISLNKSERNELGNFYKFSLDFSKSCYKD